MKQSCVQNCIPLRHDPGEALRVRLQPILQEALSGHVFSGAAILVAAPEEILFEGAYGAVSFATGAAPITTATWFDLASLTKPLATASLAMVGVSSGWLQLDEPLGHALEWTSVPDDKRGITVRQLLNHCSGLPAYRPYFRELNAPPVGERRATLIGWILREALLGAPQTITAYSDLGFMLLAEIIERRAGMRLHEAVRRLLFDPADIQEMGFRPVRSDASLDVPSSSSDDLPPVVIAQTERCPWRSRLLEGEVHDENAYALGGVAGHAGLFGTARAIHRWLGELWGVYRGGPGHNGIAPSVVREFWRRQHLVPESTWALGFDTPCASGSSAGERFSADSVGHLGFTGTSFWLDLDREILVVLLTNRVHPHRDSSSIKSFRPLIHDTVMETLYAR
jgi:CubicO group peptidase (beta-lactamase class C family)